MSREQIDEPPVGLTDDDKRELEKMLAELRRQRQEASPAATGGTARDQMDMITRRMADLTEMLINIDRQMASLAQIVRLSHQKSELLSRRLDTVISALRKGHRI